MTTPPPRPTGNLEIERLTIRVAAYGLILQGLLERLMLGQILDTNDLNGIEDFAVAIAQDLAEHGSTPAQVGGARIADEIHQYIGAIR
jgi:hypothetical protein